MNKKNPKIVQKAENCIDYCKKNPQMAIVLIIILLAFFIGKSYISSYFTEKGKQDAGSLKKEAINTPKTEVFIGNVNVTAEGAIGVNAGTVTNK